MSERYELLRFSTLLPIHKFIFLSHLTSPFAVTIYLLNLIPERPDLRVKYFLGMNFHGDAEWAKNLSPDVILKAVQKSDEFDLFVTKDLWSCLTDPKDRQILLCESGRRHFHPPISMLFIHVCYYLILLSFSFGNHQRTPSKGAAGSSQSRFSRHSCCEGCNQTSSLNTAEGILEEARDINEDCRQAEFKNLLTVLFVQ